MAPFGPVPAMVGNETSFSAQVCRRKVSSASTVSISVSAPEGASRSIQATSSARLLLFGGEPLDGLRHLWWNFVSSSRERIEQAKSDWKAGRFAPVPGDAEFIPLPEGS